MVCDWHLVIVDITTCESLISGCHLVNVLFTTCETFISGWHLVIVPITKNYHMGAINKCPTFGNDANDHM